jgi:hypothetical protein
MSFNADSAGNAQEIEMQFAVKTVEHLEVRYTALFQSYHSPAYFAAGI